MSKVIRRLLQSSMVLLSVCSLANVGVSSVDAKSTLPHKTISSKPRHHHKTHKHHKHTNKSKAQNTQLSKQDLQKIQQLTQQIQQIEQHGKKVQTNMPKPPTIKSIETIPTDGYIQLYQAFGTFPVLVQPNPQSKAIRSNKLLSQMNSNKSQNNKYWIADQIARTSDKQVYYHVTLFNGTLSGWINKKGLLPTRTINTKDFHFHHQIIAHITRHHNKGLNPDFVTAYESVLRQYISGDKQLQHLVHHTFNKHQEPLVYMYSTKDLHGKDKALSNIATRLQNIIRNKMHIKQFE